MEKLRQEVRKLALNHPGSLPDPFAMITAEREAMVSALVPPNGGAAPPTAGFRVRSDPLPKPRAFVASRGLTLSLHSPTVGGVIALS